VDPVVAGTLPKFPPGHPSERPPAAKHRRERRSGDRRRPRYPSRAGANPPVPWPFPRTSGSP